MNILEQPDIGAILARANVRVVRPLLSPNLPGHDPHEQLHTIEAKANFQKMKYRSPILIKKHEETQARRKVLTLYLIFHAGRKFTAPELQEALGVSKKAMQSDLKVLREAEDIGYARDGLMYTYFAL